MISEVLSGSNQCIVRLASPHLFDQTRRHCLFSGRGSGLEHLPHFRHLCSTHNHAAARMPTSEALRLFSGSPVGRRSFLLALAYMVSGGSMVCRDATGRWELLPHVLPCTSSEVGHLAFKVQYNWRGIAARAVQRPASGTVRQAWGKAIAVCLEGCTGMVRRAGRLQTSA